MVAVADRYENLTKARETEPLTPDRAVAQLLREAGAALDPMFTRLFVQALGVFPVGCWVRLSDQTVGVVCDKGDDPLKPKVRVVYYIYSGVFLVLVAAGLAVSILQRLH
jgi:HD-GYP domain-containing protein (c-di-GMP phosphodiesterase class II)